MRPYTGPFGEVQAAHLLRRCALAAAPEEARKLASMGLDAAVENLLGGAAQIPFPEGERLEASLHTSDDVDALAGAWLWRCAAAPEPLREHLVLFFHNHFVSAMQKVKNGRLMLGQLALFRRLGPGHFATLARAVSRDPAMLIYLDLARSSRDQPNENFARELMELFTMGTGNYTEHDIQEAARAFTGHQLRGERFRFSQAAHDPGQKRVLGRSGPLLGDDVIDLCCAHPATARFLAHKLAREFVADSPDPAVLAAISSSWTRTGGDLRAVLRDLLKSELFHAPERRYAVTRSPAALAVAVMRGLGVRLPLRDLARQVRSMGQALLDPPTVKGWEGGQAWLNPASWLARRAFLLQAGRAAADQGCLERISPARDIWTLVLDVGRHLFGSPPTKEETTHLASLCSRHGAQGRRHVLSCLLSHPRFQRC